MCVFITGEQLENRDFNYDCLNAGGVYQMFICGDKGTMFYFGQTSNFEKRFIDHLNDLCDNSHFNYRVQDAFNKSGGVRSIRFQTLDICKSKKERLRIEQKYISKFDTCLNISGKCGKIFV